MQRDIQQCTSTCIHPKSPYHIKIDVKVTVAESLNPCEQQWYAREWTGRWSLGRHFAICGAELILSSCRPKTDPPTN
jgi:hypothetical protein